MKKIIFTLTIFIFFSISAYAGFRALTYHSRAECFNNESISWDWTVSHHMRTMSYHIDIRKGQVDHYIDTGWQHTWRSAAVHWGEGLEILPHVPKKWTVQGVHLRCFNDGDSLPPHFIMTDDNDGGKDPDYWREADSYATDCSIYDGWWDKSSPKGAKI